MRTEENCYETTDLWISAFILSCSGKMLKTYRQNGRVVFVFEDKEKSEKLVQDYLTEKAKVSAKKFVDAFRGIKSLLYQVQK